MKIEKFAVEFQKIKEKGFIPSFRKGPTGVGFTLEKELGISENNIALPDLQGAELKAHRSQGNSLITLFTFNKKVWQIPPLEAIKKYGSKDKNGRLGLYYTMSLKPNSAGLLSNQFKSENILVDLRLHDKGTRARNHGTGFRTYENKLPLLFRQIEEIA